MVYPIKTRADEEDWNLIGLRENLFITVPPSDPQRGVRVGMETLKGEFNHVLREAKGQLDKKAMKNLIREENSDSQ